ncbi:MAG: hypothetical protein QOG87_1567 [Actinomycetota bacterium]
MCDVLHHRGPDDEGRLVDGDVGLGMRRLSIIDVDTGRQPIANEDGTVTVVFNGEIYNFAELRSELRARGHHFKTAGDTECIVHLYEELGDRCVERLRGMFAFALWDERRRRLLLARDRVGKKPLFYWRTDQGIWFGSELKALLQHPEFPRSVDPQAVLDYLYLGYVPGPETIYRDVRRVPPAHTLSYEAGSVRTARYWGLAYEPKQQISEDDAVEALKEALLEAVRLRLVSERPVGAFLSSGIDSSLVVAAMAQVSSDPVRTFTVGFDDDRYDERAGARLTAARYGTDHTELVVRPNALEILPTLVWHYDQPFGDASALPSYYLARMTAEHVTVALNGDGGDESFAGYLRYAALAYADRVPVPRALHPLGRSVAARMPWGRHQRSMLSRAKRFLDMAMTEPGARYARVMAIFNEEQRATLCTDELLAGAGRRPEGVLLDAWDAAVASNPVERAMGTDVPTYLADDLLVKMDIATMANSLEARSPLLDHEVMELAASFPLEMKLKGRTGKHLLRRLAREWVPAEVVDGPKRGFAVPIGAWLRGELRELAWDTLTDATAAGRGYVRVEQVRRLLTEHEAGADHTHRLWALLQLELWQRMFLDQRAATAPARPAALDQSPS